MKIVRRSSLMFAAMLSVIIGGGIGVIGAFSTPLGAWIGIVPVVIIGWFALRRPFRRWRVMKRAMPMVWTEWLETHVPFYVHLTVSEKRRFERDVRFVMSEWKYEGVQGVDVTDDLRLGVAAGVALLLHGRPDWELAPDHTVLFYPDRFDEDYFDGDYASYDGMAHAQGPVILSARAVERSWSNPGDGSNVVLHELAHLFDFENAYADGVPSLMDPKSAEAWQQLARQETQRARLGKSVLRRYAGTSPAELFAVGTEMFFEKPELLRRRHPELYAAFVAFYNLVPDLEGRGEEEYT